MLLEVYNTWPLPKRLMFYYKQAGKAVTVKYFPPKLCDSPPKNNLPHKWENCFEQPV
ncbi:hypothetical protein LSH36_32g06009 [Paralvinella palmiformis]|uniref:Uncharacterized protein n=1 Tax=Paralvinella palmiformis TaxID=53620 RepID=A0AAD9K8N4_9ANNE|nr:hypothetical protein LSH36_32g06009 [Paralvinella palmiformis]